MPETYCFSCPICGQELQVDARIVQGQIACSTCRSHVPIPPREETQQGEATEKQPADAIQQREANMGNPVPWQLGSRRDAEPTAPDIKIKAGTHFESLAVTALLLPLIVQCFLLLGNFDSITANLAIGWGGLFVTAVLLTIDAYCLGAVDLQGNNRGGIGGLFLGLVLVWVVFYPLAFFRRRHFGKPNLGPLAILVAAIFIITPFAKESINKSPVVAGRVGRLPLEDGPPPCTGHDVRFLVEDMIRKSALGPSVKAVGGFREVKFDRAAQIRTGRCVIETDRGDLTVTYEVSWIDRNKGAFNVRTLRAGEDPRGYLGIAMDRVNGPPPKALMIGEGGVFVKAVIPNEAAEKAGILPGDIIVRINNEGFGHENPIRKFQQVVMDLEPGSEVPVELLRDEERRQVRVIIGKRPPHLP
jgi:membrane-associated protease RseP (regulator of RpoE activity)